MHCDSFVMQINKSKFLIGPTCKKNILLDKFSLTGGKVKGVKAVDHTGCAQSVISRRRGD